MRDQSFHDYVVHDILGDLPGITSRAMFGGWGIYRHGVIFGLIVEGALYFKVGESNQADFQKAESQPFVYERKGKKVSLSYWLVPERILEDRETLRRWVEKSVRASEDERKKKWTIK
ncbi:MAG: TfoX/Sxy family protein [Candidatus Jorgensenbacteria bacterium]|nr:TfoX/Sxy family protein [Candidatus Jorgensenbacteria bacterium]